MSFIDEVRVKRKKLADVLSDEDYSGIREIVEELYPDKAHFIYELLQNAEDTGANAVTFTLFPDRLLFEHIGRAFSEDDVWGITNIGKGTKKADDEAIGRFGVGFKAVFAYTETPRIWSPTFCFQVSELVLPSQLPPIPKLGNTTRFEFPFNNQKKATADAYAEVEDGLNELSETTLLFLSHIESIAWKLSGISSGEVLRIPHSDHHIEILKQVEGKTTGSSHYLRFTKPVEGVEKQRIAIAFAMDLLPTVDSFISKKPLAEQLRIVSGNPGRVAVFFPAEKETSGLRFHLHAPFVPELSRASIKETPANVPLYGQLASLAALSLHEIRDLKLLTADFLGVLPNPQDDIPDRYLEIRRAIIAEMNEEPLTPTYSKGHAPAKQLLQARASLKALLSLDDMKILIDGTERAPRWAIGAAQKNSAADRFLSGLAIRDWDVEQFVAFLEDQASDKYRWDSSGANRFMGINPSFIEWITAKPHDWHQKFYALLAEDCLGEPEHSKKKLLEKLKPLHIVRLSNGEYSQGSRCFFPTDEVEDDELLPRVARSVFSSGRKKIEQESARKLLEALGVRDVGAAEQIEAILRRRYVHTDLRPLNSDLSLFFTLLEGDVGYADLFKDYWIFELDDDMWGQPCHVYLDAPYLDTGLSAYYRALGDKANRNALSRNYLKSKISIKRLVDFAKRTGVSTELTIEQDSFRNNPYGGKLIPRGEGGKSSYRVDQDYIIRGVEQALEREDEQVSRLVWRTCSNEKQLEWTKARYRSNSSYPVSEVPSQLALILRTKKWIPQKGGTFVCPADADRDLLPDGFAFDPGWPWLDAIEFGESIAKQSAESRRKREVAKEAGFNDEESYNDAKWFAELDPEERQRFKKQYESTHRTELPEQEPADPERRARRVQVEASEAPERITERRTRSVSVGRESVKKGTDPYLRQQYTNGDGETICQVCKAALPFKLPDGSYYLEAVEFLPELERRHYQNYLALCPNHAAMFQHANGSREIMMDLFLDIDIGGNELEVILADENSSIYFTKPHITDLKAIIGADEAGKGEEE